MKKIGFIGCGNMGGAILDVYKRQAAGFFSRHGRYRNLKSIEMFLYEKPFDKTQRVGRIFSELFVACPVGKVMK